MSFAKTVFIAIDHLFNRPQNRTKILRETRHVKCDADIAYGEEPECKLDLYYVPKEDGKYPVIFEIHGGGFVAGDKKYRRALSRWYAANTGAMVVNVNYGLAPEVKFPTPMQQLVKAVNWVKDNADKYNFDLTKFVATGDSAGGYYAAMLCVIQDSDVLQEQYGKMNAKFTGCALNCGICDLETALKTKILFNLTGKIWKDYTGEKMKDMQNYKYLNYLSPSHYITDKFPTAFFVYAKKDFFCGGQGEALKEQLDSLGVYNESYGSTKFMDNHTFPIIWNTKAAKESNAMLLSFLNRFFAGEI